MKKGQELPGWTMVVGMLIALIVIILIIWIAVKSGKTGAEQIAYLQ